MPVLLLDINFLAGLHKLQPGVREKVLELPAKFHQAQHAGAHLEKLNGCADDRVRTVRVDKFWRGVVVKLSEGRFALLRVLPHDDANAWAVKQKFGINPVTGIVELVDVPTVAEQVESVTSHKIPGQPGIFDDVPDKAFRQVGVDEDFVPLLRRLTEEAEVLAIAALLPKAQGDAVLLLADGRTPEEVWAELAEDYELTGEEIDTDDLDAALERPATRAEFVVTSTNDELMALLSDDFEVWRTFLHPAQNSIANKPAFKGPFRLTGGAGTGKTVVAIHRARFLARQLIESEDSTRRILFATYTTSLASNLEDTLRSFCSSEEYGRIQVSTVDSLAFQIMQAAGVASHPIDAEVLRDLVNEVAAQTAIHEIGIDGRYLLSEWSQVILGRDIKSLSEYVKTPRPGRGRSINRPDRQRVWSAVTKLTQLLQQRNLSTFPQIAARAAEKVKMQESPPYVHVIVDEAQDLHPAQWRLLRSCVANGTNDLFIVGDAHQRIYDNRVSLSSLGIETRGRSRRLKINYRTSQQILGWALGILSGEPIDDLDGNVERQIGYRSEFQGPVPIIRSFDSQIEEAQYVAEIVASWMQEGVAANSIGIVSRTNASLSSVKQALNHATFQWGEIGSAKNSEGIQIGTMHSSKGLEFARLAVVGVSLDRVPLQLAVAPKDLDPNQHELDMRIERCLLYVACTRARDSLVVTSTGAPSGLLPNLV